MLISLIFLPTAWAADSKQDKDWEKLNKILAQEVEKDNQKNGNDLSATRIGNFTYVGPVESNQKKKPEVKKIEMHWW